jgi:hypothetical protein
VGDVDLLPQVLEEASRFGRRPDDSALERLVRDEEMSPLFA